LFLLCEQVLADRLLAMRIPLTIDVTTFMVSPIRTRSRRGFESFRAGRDEIMSGEGTTGSRLRPPGPAWRLRSVLAYFGLAGSPCETSRFENPFISRGRERPNSGGVRSDRDSETGATLVPTANDFDCTDCCRCSHYSVCRSPVDCFRLVGSSGPLRVSARNGRRTGQALDSLADVERPVRRKRERDGPRVGNVLVVYHGAQRERRGVVRPP